MGEATISYRGHRFPPLIISHVGWLYYRLSLSFRDVEDLLAERGIIVSYEAIRHRTAEEFGTPGNLVNGASISGFMKVADAMMDQGVVQALQATPDTSILSPSSGRSEEGVFFVPQPTSSTHRGLRITTRSSALLATCSYAQLRIRANTSQVAPPLHGLTTTGSPRTKRSSPQIRTRPRRD